MTKVRLCFHDHCFDGAASAALFYRFYRDRMNPKAEFHFTGMTHRAQQPWENDLFDGDENVIVDFKYSSSPRVTVTGIRSKSPKIIKLFAICHLNSFRIAPSNASRSEFR